MNFRKIRLFMIWGIFVLICFVSYGNSIKNDFVFDDKSLIVENKLIKDVKNIPQILGIFYGKLNYRSIRNLSYSLDYFFTKLNPVGYHISNIMYHSITVFLIYLIVLSLSKNFKVAFFTAIIFAIHPIHTDAVTYISGRRDILFTLFFLLGFYYFLKYRASLKIKYTILTVISFILAIFSKEMAITLPLVMFCYDYYQEFRPNDNSVLKLTFFKRLIGTGIRVLSKYKFFYISLILFSLSIIYYYVIVVKISRQLTWYGNNIISNFATVTKIWVFYIKLLLFPIKLNADYSYNAFPLSKSYFSPLVLLSVFILTTIFYLCLLFLNKEKSKIYAFCILFYFVTLLPISHIIPHHELLAEHYLYLPSLSFCLLLGLLFEKGLHSQSLKNFTWPLLIVLIFGYSARTIIRNRDWRNEEVFWEKTIRTAPNCVRAHDSLGVVYKDKGSFVKAIAEFKEALKIDPGYFRAHYNLGNLYENRGEFQKAIEEYQAALRLNPSDFQSHNNLGNIYLEKGLYQKAIYELRKALEIEPRSARLHNNLANIYKESGLIEKAVKEYYKAIELDSSLTGAHCNLGILYHKTGELDKALEEYQNALKLDPKLILIRYNLGVIFANRGEYDLARSEWEFVLTLDPYYEPARKSLKKLKRTSY